MSSGALEVVATSPGFMVTNAAVTSNGRLFGGSPRWKPGGTPCVAEFLPDGTWQPFPGGAWNEWVPGQAPQEAFVCVHGLYIDESDQMWVLDDGAPFHSDIVPGAPKVVQVDVTNGSIVRIYLFGPDLAPEGSILSHVRVDATHLYVTDSAYGALVVVDRITGRGRRLLEGEPCSRADPEARPVIHGKPVLDPQGRVPVLHLSHLELSDDGEWLYFMPLFGPTLRRVPVAVLRDPAFSSKDVAARVEDVATVPACAGMHRDGKGGLILCAATDGSILRLNVQGDLETLLSDERISFPNEGSGVRDGAFYFPNSYAHLIGRPYEIFKMVIA
ncbi:L-dopachrome tautomerase-related protein [Ottowia thiooxydans]|uniref:Major royal jelly protein n=1 Tax=Ottowia thiooxydans TaxID=219182 RepID=A0ABV2QAA2_9BURK